MAPPRIRCPGIPPAVQRGGRAGSTVRRAALIAVLLMHPPASADTIRVPADRHNLNAALSSAHDGDTVLVADGVYTGPANRTLDFRGKAITLRSEHGPQACIIDC